MQHSKIEKKVQIKRKYKIFTFDNSYEKIEDLAKRTFDSRRQAMNFLKSNQLQIFNFYGKTNIKIVLFYEIDQHSV